MSDKVIKAIVCPGCGELSKAEIHTSINPARDKTIRKECLTESCLISDVRPAATPLNLTIRFYITI